MTSGVESDVELVERSRRSDARAFGELVARHQRLVFGVALAHCRDRALAEDVAQEAFVAAWRDLDRLRDGTRVGPWVAGIARNLAANAVRTRARREQIAIDAPASAPSPEDVVREREDQELLSRALADIPDAHRETLVLFYLEGESIGAIARALGVTEDVIKQRLTRGRRTLRQSVVERVESVLARTRVRPTFGAAVLAGLSTAGARKASAGKAAFAMSMNKLVVVAVGAAVVGGTAWWLGTRTHSAPSAQAASAQQQVGSARARLHVAKLRDKAARDALVAAIHDARAKRTASSTGNTGAPPSTSSTSSSSQGPAPALPDDGDLDKDYIRSAMQDLIPLLTECYEHGLERDPKLAGTVAVEFTIEGEPGVGGVVGESKIDPDPTETSLGDPDVRECIQETMYALEIDPPKNGGTVRVHYPFTFHPAGSD
ncbi:MAG TPA: sigma-70 family RNA polymerase sigma factor [Kofleriaceae bacterium]|jgi:RNA polymerase sigma factor (sigma-70 family)